MQAVASLTFQPYCLRWVPQQVREERCLVAVSGKRRNNKGTATIFQLVPSDGIPNTNLFAVNEVETDSPIKSLAFPTNSPDGHMVTGHFDGLLQLWDVEHMDLPIWRSKNGHKHIIHSISCHTKESQGIAPEFITTSRDRTVMLWDTRNKSGAMLKIEEQQEKSETGQTKQIVESWYSIFGPGGNQIISGYSDGSISCFDLRNLSQLWNVTLPSDPSKKKGVCDMDIQTLASGEKRLLVGTTGSTLETLSLNESGPPKLLHSTKTHENTTVWCCKSMPGQSSGTVASAGGNGEVLLWEEGKPETPKQRHSLGDTAVISLDCNTSFPGLFATVGLNQLLHILFSPPPLSS